MAYLLLYSLVMARTSKKIIEVNTSKTSPYDQLRRARHGELRLKDAVGLHLLMDDYFGNADDVDYIGPPTTRAA